jgi:hypothetical protein
VPVDGRASLDLLSLEGVFLGAAALLRDAGGGFTSGIATLALLPVFWVAPHGSRAGLGLVVLGVAAFLAMPVLAIGGPRTPRRR